MCSIWPRSINRSFSPAAAIAWANWLVMAASPLPAKMNRASGHARITMAAMSSRSKIPLPGMISAAIPMSGRSPTPQRCRTTARFSADGQKSARSTPFGMTGRRPSGAMKNRRATSAETHTIRFAHRSSRRSKNHARVPTLAWNTSGRRIVIA